MVKVNFIIDYIEWDKRNIVVLKWLDSTERAEFIEALLKTWGWDFECGLTDCHGSVLGNCEHDDNDMISSGNYNTGMYMNAAWYCDRCYKSNPAMLEWDENKIVLYCGEESTKVLTIFKIMHDTNPNAYWECETDVMNEIEKGILKHAFEKQKNNN